jgi:hypothetical protein
MAVIAAAIGPPMVLLGYTLAFSSVAIAFEPSQLLDNLISGGVPALSVILATVLPWTFVTRKQRFGAGELIAHLLYVLICAALIGIVILGVLDSALMEGRAFEASLVMGGAIGIAVSLVLLAVSLLFGQRAHALYLILTFLAAWLSRAASALDGFGVDALKSALLNAADFGHIANIGGMLLTLSIIGLPSAIVFGLIAYGRHDA